MFIDNYQPDHDAEMETAFADMDAYYHKPYSVKCGFCGLEQTAPEATLREIGWTLDKQEFCFQAKCIRDREDAKDAYAEDVRNFLTEVSTNAY